MNIMNDSNTHLSIKHDNIPILCYGYIPNHDDKSLNSKDTWSYSCVKHLSEITCKKQYCNNCNKKSTIKNLPKICLDCADKIIENCIIMTDVCKYPIISREECRCIYCTKQVKK